MQSSPTELLAELGMRRPQALVYLALLQLGQATAYAVAERCGLKRPNVYVLMRELVRAGAVQRVPHARKQLYRAKDPQSLYRERLSKLSSVEAGIPALQALAPVEDAPATFYFEGEKGLRQALEYKLDEVAHGELRGFFAQPVEHAPAEATRFTAYYLERLARANVRLRGFVPEHAGVRRKEVEVADSLQLDFKHIAPREYDAEVSLEIGKDFIRIFALGESQAVVISNPRVARTLGQVFEMLWKRIEKKPASKKPSRR